MPDLSTTDELVIELSKTKVVLTVIGCLAFVALGAWLFAMDAETIARELRGEDPLVVHGGGIAAVVFFGIIGILALRKLFNRKPGLVLNSSGIIDNSSGIAAGFIPWSDIRGAEIYQMARQKILVIKLNNPKEYIARGSALRRATNLINAKMTGSPVAITSTTLKVNFAELLATFDQYQRKYGGSATASTS
ncbi:MAG TPA: STM3941 family protein [Candidatus Angelobacter sp.]|nr:STM3941 family protein [Candidatus Angelobacter sp.]